MQLSYLPEVSLLITAHHQLLMNAEVPVPAQTLGDYYILSRNRFNGWIKEITDLERGVSPTALGTVLKTDSVHPLRQLAERILMNEMVCRIWTATLISRDHSLGKDDAGPLMHNVYLGQLSIRHRVLSACLNAKDLSPSDLTAVNRLREVTERWTDLLLAPVIGNAGLWTYAFDEHRARDFFAERSHRDSELAVSQSWMLMLTGLRHAFGKRLASEAYVPDEDRALIRLMLSAFPSDNDRMAFWMSQKMREMRQAALR